MKHYISFNKSDDPKSKASPSSRMTLRLLPISYDSKIRKQKSRILQPNIFIVK